MPEPVRRKPPLKPTFKYIKPTKPFKNTTTAITAAQNRPYVMAVLQLHQLEFHDLMLSYDGYPKDKRLREECMRARSENYIPVRDLDNTYHQQKTVVTPQNRILGGAICGSPRKVTEGVCCMPAGWGTDHPGRGPCKKHGGNTKANNKHYLMDQIRENQIMYGAPIEITAEDAIRQELQRTAGHVFWLQQEISRLQDTQHLSQVTNSGRQASFLLNQYDKERQNLVKVSKIAIDSGFKEREVQVIEEQGRMIAQVLQSFVRDPELQLTPQQLSLAPGLMRKHLIAIDATSTPAEPILNTTLET